MVVRCESTCFGPDVDNVPRAVHDCSDLNLHAAAVARNAGSLVVSLAGAAAAAACCTTHAHRSTALALQWQSGAESLALQKLRDDEIAQ
jgi:hypothetical protein